MKVLITGGAGFIGSHLAERLIKSNVEIYIIDNFETGRKENISKHSSIKLFEGSINDKNFLSSVFSELDLDLVVHAAASYKDPHNWAADVDTNIHGTINTINECKKNNVNRIIYFQTSLCYGLKPIESPITLNHPLQAGGSSYAISKTAAELFIAMSGLSFISFRLANAYGPRNLSGPVPTFYKRLSEGLPCFVMDTKRDFIFIDDLIDVVEKAVLVNKYEGYYHISTGRDYAIKEVYESIVESMDINLNTPVEVRERSKDDVATLLIDPTKTQVDFNWKDKTPLKKGIHQAIQWYKSNHIDETYTHLNIGKNKS